MQFKNQRGVKKKSLNSYNYPNTQNYKIHVQNSRKHYYIFEAIFYLTKQLQKIKIARSHKNYFYGQKIWLAKMLNTAYNHQKTLYKFKLLRKAEFPRLIKVFKSIRFKKKTDTLQLDWEKIKLTAKEIMLKNSSYVFYKKLKPEINEKLGEKLTTIEIKATKKYTASKMGKHIKNQKKVVKFLEKIDNKNRMRRKINSLKYRVQYKTNYKQFVTFATKQQLKHMISTFLQNYFHLTFNILLTNIGNSLHDKRYQYICFPVKENKKQHNALTLKKKLAKKWN